MTVPMGYDVHATTRIDPATVTCRAIGNAEPTSRVMTFAADQEWSQHATTPANEPCVVYYEFGVEEIQVADNNDEHYPWDDEHVTWIQLLD